MMLLPVALLVDSSGIPQESRMSPDMVGTVRPYTFDGTRGMRFCEVWLATPEGIFMYSTTGLNDCPAAAWNALDIEKIKAQTGAQAVFKNGPHFWVSDTLIVELGATKEFGGMKARYVGMLPAELVRGKSGGAGEGEPYKVYHPKKAGKITYSKGKPVFELVGPDGASYVMQAAGALVDPNLTYESLATLGDKLKLAPGWKYHVRNLDNDLVFDFPKGTVVTAVSDDLRNIYNLAPKRDTPR